MKTDEHALTTEAILALFDRVQADQDVRPDEGLRDRKKRRQRQRISNVATAMFLAEGFDSVSDHRVSSCPTVAGSRASHSVRSAAPAHAAARRGGMISVIAGVRVES